MNNGPIKLGFIGSSTKENEKRVAIHPDHFRHFDKETQNRVFVEKGYGKSFRIPDAQFVGHVAGLMDRKELFEKCDAVMIFKPTELDFPYLRQGQTLWGAVHCVQNENIVQMAIDKKMTLIAMEYMYLWNGEKRGEWLFHTQSEFAGYCSVMHALQLLGTKGWHDQPKRCAIIGFGSTGRGAIHALKALDFTDITVFTGRPPVSVRHPDPIVKQGQYLRDPTDDTRTLAKLQDEQVPFGQLLSQYDVIINCILQDTDRPFMFASSKEVQQFKPGTLIVDVSCDHGLGFDFAKPTSFDDPMFEVNERVIYYAVDHSPSLLFNTASLEHSKSAYPYVKDMAAGREAWHQNPTLQHAIDIENGIIQNQKIITFQNREKSYPHKIMK